MTLGYIQPFNNANEVKTLFLALTVTSVVYSVVEPETLHREDAEAVEEYLTNLGFPSEYFRVAIVSEEVTVNYILQWPGFFYDSDADDYMAAVIAQDVSAKAVAYAISRAEWGPGLFVLLFEDCWTITPFSNY
jgi:hypothetical protein